MRMRSALLASVCVTFVLAAGADPSRAQTRGPALTGQVTSDQEGPMEGVLVTAKKAGSTIAITVVTDKDGRYSFPASRLEPGQYAIRIRAAGYDLDGKGAADVAGGKTASIDLKLKKTQQPRRPAHQCRVDQQHAGHAAAEGCAAQLRHLPHHRPHRAVDPRRRRVRAGPAAHGDLCQPERADAAAETPRRAPARGTRRHAQHGPGGTRRISRLDQPERSTRPGIIRSRPLPRPTGRATQVIITEYDLPRQEIEPHDVIVGNDGTVWYTNFGEQNIGKMDPKTGKVTEITLPELKKGWPQGSLGLASGQATAISGSA